MSSKIFIGGLSYKTTETSLGLELEKYGKVISIRIVTERETGKSRGFGFATFESEEATQEAIKELNNTLFEGRRIGVKEAIDRE